MLNDRIELLGIHPFPRVSKLLGQVTPSTAHEPIDLTIGEPQFIPDQVRDLLARTTVMEEDYRKYPPNAGTHSFISACIKWLAKRYRFDERLIGNDNIVPTAGAREALFQLGLLGQSSNQKRKIAMPVPHYAPYRASGILFNQEILWCKVSKKSLYLGVVDIIRVAQRTSVYKNI